MAKIEQQRPQDIELTFVRTDGGTQPRGELDRNHVERLMAVLSDPDAPPLPPVHACYDGNDYWLWDGFHRLDAHRQAGMATIPVIVHQGSKEDAQWFSVRANREHDRNGLPRTNADKRRAVEAALRHENGASMSNVKLAEWIGVSEFLVRKLRDELPTSIESKSERVGRDGRTINTANIGKSKAEEKPAPAATASPLTPIPVTFGDVSDEEPLARKPAKDDGGDDPEDRLDAETRFQLNAQRKIVDAAKALKAAMQAKADVAAEAKALWSAIEFLTGETI